MHALAPSPLRRSTLRSRILATACAVLASASGAAAQKDDACSPDAVLARIQAKFGANEKKYDALAEKIDKEVRKALTSAVWLTAKQAGTPRTFAQHPLFVLIEQLSRDARAEISKGDGKRKKARDAMLAKFPCGKRLELDLGLELGSDRPVPTHEKGFIALGDAPTPVCGFPELSTNQYLYGLQEISGWRAGVERGKQLAFGGRETKKPLAVEATLPGWESIRVYVQGSLPEVPLFAMPWLTHGIHARLVERRRSPSGELARMDEMLAFLDSKWNGFTFQLPFSKERVAVVQPVHALMTDRNGFFYRFPGSDGMAKVGDLPFVCIPTYSQYAQVFLGKRIDSGEFIASSAPARAAGESLQADCVYLARYKALVDQVVRAVLAPSVPFPAYLAILDYPKGRMPDARENDPDFDVVRRHALLVWAYVGKDPAKLADFLHDELLDEEANRFPNAVGLSALFATVVRNKEPELLKSIAERISAERQSAPAAEGEAKLGDFEREFSPFPELLEASGEPASGYLLGSFHLLHGAAAKLVSDTACAVVAKEIGN